MNPTQDYFRYLHKRGTFIFWMKVNTNKGTDNPKSISAGFGTHGLTLHNFLIFKPNNKIPL